MPRRWQLGPFWDVPVDGVHRVINGDHDADNVGVFLLGAVLHAVAGIDSGVGGGAAADTCWSVDDELGELIGGSGTYIVC